MNIASTNAGPASITAAADTAGGEPSSQIDIEFVAVEAASLILQASPTSLGVNQGDSEDQQSIITAIVRDTNNNLVKNQTSCPNNLVLLHDVRWRRSAFSCPR